MNNLKETYQNDIKNKSVVSDPKQIEILGILDSIDKNKRRKLSRTFIQLHNNFPFKNFKVGYVKGLYLWGSVGRGKSYLMDLFYKTTGINRKKRIHFHNFMRQVHEELRKYKNKTDPLEYVSKKWAKDYQILCLDEFQVTDITDAMLLSKLFQGLYSKGVTMITTSNTPPDSLYEGGLQRERFLPAIECIKSNNIVKELSGAYDYRLRTLEDASVFFIGGKNAHDNTFKMLFDKLIGISEIKSDSLTIDNRMINPVQYSDGVIWFDFIELCQTNRSTADYTELAILFHTIFLSDVPRLNSDNDDSIRRFINFIDEIYDRNVNLIMSFECEPSNLYSGTRLAQTFKRTISRLTEMRSKSYLSLPHRKS